MAQDTSLCPYCQSTIIAGPRLSIYRYTLPALALFIFFVFSFLLTHDLGSVHSNACLEDLGTGYRESHYQTECI